MRKNKAMVELSKEQAARAVKLLKSTVDESQGLTFCIGPTFRELRDALLREIEPDPVAELTAYFDLTSSDEESARKAWAAVKPRLAAPALDEAAIRDDEARLCARWCHNRYAAIKAASVHGGVEDDSDIISRAGILDGIAEVERAVARGEHRPQPDRGAS